MDEKNSLQVFVDNKFYSSRFEYTPTLEELLVEHKLHRYMFLFDLVIPRPLRMDYRVVVQRRNETSP